MRSPRDRCASGASKEKDEQAGGNNEPLRARLLDLYASAIASGDVGWLRVIGANGRAVADFVVSAKDGPGSITFNTLAFRKGGPVSFFGRMAIFSQKPMMMT